MKIFSALFISTSASIWPTTMTPLIKTGFGKLKMKTTNNPMHGKNVKGQKSKIKV